MESKIFDVVVIGAGFAGLTCAGRLLGAFPEDLFKHTASPSPPAPHQGLTVAVLEARDRVGGRAYSLPLQANSDSASPSHAPSHTTSATASTPAVSAVTPTEQRPRRLRRGSSGNGSSSSLSLPSQSSHQPQTLPHQQQQPQPQPGPQGLRFDLGASWLHESCAENPFTSLIRSFACKTVLHDDLTPSILFDSVEDCKLSKMDIFSAKHKAREILESAKASRPKAGEADRPLNADIRLPATVRPIEARATRWFLHETEQLLATSFDVLSGAHWDDYAETCFEGPDEFVVDSVGVVVERLAEYIRACPRASIHLSSPVQSIRKREEDGLIEITCAGDYITHQPQKFLARRVVCTIPLGVLKAGEVKFSPPLRESKQQAIANLGVGIMNKIILEYDECFWNPEERVFGHMSDKWGEFPWFINLKKETGRNVLVCFLVGKVAEEMEGWGDAKTLLGVQRILQAMFPGEVSSRPPKSFLITRWSKDPFARGSYAMYQVGSSAADCREFEVPEWESTLYFAGEHMSWNEQGFVHGAILTGMKAADAILSGDRKFMRHV